MADTSTPGESWKSVVGWEGLYEVSDQGNVR
ncbi:NUMOD4 domain-containing protein, partial [Corynebacterium sp. AOP36-E1-14]